MWPTVTVTVTVPPETDKYGDPIAGSGSTSTIEDAMVAPRTSSENGVRGRTGVVVGLQIFCPLGTTPPPHTARVTVPGYDGTYELDGDPASWPQGGVVLNVKRATG